MQPKAWIRVDANNTIGRGHLSRCIALADMITEDFEVYFLINQSNKEYCTALLNGRNSYYFSKDSEIDHLLNQQDLLIVDSYQIDNGWRIHFQNKVDTLIDINDIPGEIRGADIIINHCPGIKQEMYVADTGATFLLGLEFVILRSEFLNYARESKPSIQGSGVFICFGGADPYQLGIHATKELLQSGFTDPIYLVTPTITPTLDRLRDENTNLQVLNNLSADKMRKFMLSSRLLLLSSSILSFEAIALRKPLLILYFVDNQKMIYKGLIDRGLAKGYGRVNDSNDISDIASSLIELYQSDEQLLNLLKRQEKTIDGDSSRKIREYCNIFLNKKNKFKYL